MFRACVDVALGAVVILLVLWVAVQIKVNPETEFTPIYYYYHDYYYSRTFLQWVEYAPEPEPEPKPTFELLGDADRWLVMIRIQKTGTKTFLGNLQAIHAALGRPYCSNTPWCCTSVPEFSPGNRVRPCDGVLRDFYASTTRCRTLTEPHSDYADATRPIDGPFSTILLLRDPVARVVSEYKHLSGGSDKPRKNWDYTPADHEPKTWQNFLAFLTDERNAPGMRNRQTRMLAGCGSGVRCEDVYATEEEMLAEAIRHLHEAAFVGVTDRFEDTLDLLWWTFGLERPSNPDSYRRMDRYDGHDVFSVEDQHAIRVYNELDTRLYQEASAIFDVAWKSAN